MASLVSETMQSPLMLRVRSSGKCPPNLVREEATLHGKPVDDGFDETVIRSLDTDSLAIRDDVSSAEEFNNILKVSSKC